MSGKRKVVRKADVQRGPSKAEFGGPPRLTAADMWLVLSARRRKLSTAMGRAGSIYAGERGIGR